ncbi:MAG: hypothetical protein ACXWHB_17125, partial [Usitatibacter sp.]
MKAGWLERGMFFRVFEKSNPMDHPVALHGRHFEDLKATGDPLDYSFQKPEKTFPFPATPPSLPMLPHN